MAAGVNHFDSTSQSEHKSSQNLALYLLNKVFFFFFLNFILYFWSRNFKRAERGGGEC